MPGPDFGRFLDRSLVVLAAEVPAAYRGVANAIGEQPMRIVVDGKAHRLRFQQGQHEISADGDAAGELRTSSASILALVDGRIGLVDSLLGEQLFLRGPLEVIVCFDCALRSYLAGAVRAAGFAALLRDYRLHAAREESLIST